MYTIIIFSIILCFIFGFTQYKYGYFNDNMSVFLNSIVGLLIGFVLGLLMALILPADLQVKKTEKQLQVLNDNSSTTGSFFLGSGNISGTMQYVFYSKENNQFKLNLVNYEKAKIEYTDDAPTVVKYYEVHSDSFINFFAFDVTAYWYLFKIPKGSISNNYSLNAE